ncbi:cyclic nucleotide-binding domain-containing protein [Pirellulales bacterium]|nr:cyclic nucleotide-binding domain-containing protein [Pirellulales bacterium]
MKIFDLTWDEIAECLEQIPGYTPSKTGSTEKFSTGDVSNRMFFKVQYDAGEIVMPQGVCTDFAGLLLEGSVKVVDAPSINQLLARQREAIECWQPRSRWWNWIRRCLGKTPTASELTLADPIEHGVLDDTNSCHIGRRKARDYPGDDHFDATLADGGTDGQLRPSRRRLIGLTGAMWNTPRTYTLVAEDDRNGNRCTLLLIKRKVLLTIESKSAEFRRERKAFFLEKELPGQLLSNRIFANTLHPDDIVNWASFVQSLKPTATNNHSAAVQHIRAHWDAQFRRWFDDLQENTLEEYDQYELLRGLNTCLRNHGLFDEVAWNRDQLPECARSILQMAPEKRTRNQLIQLNRCLYEAALPGKIRPPREYGPLSRDDYVEYAREIRSIAEQIEESKAVEVGHAIQLLHFEFDPKERAEKKPDDKRTDLIYRQDSVSESVYLLLSGRVRITQRLADDGEEVLLNHLSQHGYFGLSCLQNGRDARHSATVTAMSQVDVACLHRELVSRLSKRFPFLDRKLKGELARLDKRVVLQRQPPVDPPARLASKLMAATNLLLIDMDLCTRCDKCVQACGDAHDGVARFHRSRPDQRFNQWEVAGACVHCEDPPCQKACPVGAITIEFGSTVQIHRNRCIGCTACARECPFDVIEMQTPMQHDLPLPVPGVTKAGIASKCDLCLTDDKDPPCVVACPYGAAQRGAPRSLLPGIKSWTEITPT